MRIKMKQLVAIRPRTRRREWERLQRKIAQEKARPDGGWHRVGINVDGHGVERRWVDGVQVSGPPPEREWSEGIEFA